MTGKCNRVQNILHFAERLATLSLSGDPFGLKAAPDRCEDLLRSQASPHRERDVMFNDSIHSFSAIG
jgi:hypothetical protein